MKKSIFILAFGFAFLGLHAQQPAQETLKVNGQILTTVSGAEIILRGINYPIIDDGDISLANAAQYEHKIDEAALTGANAIRIPWYTDGTHWRDNPDFGGPGIVQGYVNDGHLSDLIGYCYTKGMIPILEIHNITCSNNWETFNNVVMPWWESETVLNIIEEHKEYIIINPANEFGYAMWAGNTAAAMTIFQNNYNAAISSLRSLGVDVPIMIDAPDCGQSSSELLSVSENMLMNDPEQNLIFSAHAYWYSYASTQNQIEAKIAEIEDSGVCFVFGEIASTQDGDACGSLSLEEIYPIIMEEACNANIGWLAWTYTLDCSAGREMTTNGEFNTLTEYGDDLVNNPVYGLKSTGGCGAQALSLNNYESVNTIVIYPNPASDKVYVKSNNDIQVIGVEIYDISGRRLNQLSFNDNEIDISYLAAGNYFIKINAGSKSTTHKIQITN